MGIASLARGAVLGLKLKAVAGVVIITFVILGAYVGGLIPSSGGAVCGLSPLETIQLPDTSGRIDHMAYDPALHLLYVAALGNDSVKVINVSSSAVLKTISGFNEPQGVLYVPTTSSIFVSNGGTGVVSVLNAISFASVANITLGADADNMRYDPTSNLVLVAYGSGGIAAIDPSTFAIRGKVQLTGHPEGFQFDSTTMKIFVNVAENGYVVAANSVNYSVSARWPISNASGNFPMAIDTATARLFIGTRSPSQLQILDASSGSQIATLNIPQDPDDIFFDTARGCVYISTGAGYVASVHQSGSSYNIVGTLSTSIGARTSLLAQESGLYFVAAPSTQSGQAKVLVYRTG